MAYTQTVNSWTTGRTKPVADAPLNFPTIMQEEFEALTIVNIGKGHYLPGERGFATPGRVAELVDEGLVKRVGKAEVPKEARADDGAYAEEPATDLATELTRTKVEAELPVEESVAAISVKEAEADNKAIDDAEAAKSTESDAEKDGKAAQKEDKSTAGRQTKEDKQAADKQRK